MHTNGPGPGLNFSTAWRCGLATSPRLHCDPHQPRRSGAFLSPKFFGDSTRLLGSACEGGRARTAQGSASERAGVGERGLTAQVKHRAWALRVGPSNIRQSSTRSLRASKIRQCLPGFCALRAGVRSPSGVTLLRGITEILCNASKSSFRHGLPRRNPFETIIN